MKIWKNQGKHRRNLRLIVIICLLFSIALAAGMSQWIRAATWPLCDWNCASNDMELTESWVGDGITGGELPPCTWGTNMSAWLWGNISVQGGGVEDYAVYVLYETWIDNVLDTELQAVCVANTINSTNDGALLFAGPVEWICGQEVEIRDVVVTWTPDSTQDCSSVPACKGSEGNRQSKCDIPGEGTAAEGIVEVRTPLAVEFSSNAPTCFSSNVTFESITTGGQAPYYFSWDYDNDGTFEIENSLTANVTSYHYTSPGTYSVNFSVTDSNGPPPNTAYHINPVEIYQNPTATASNNGPACVGEDVQLTDGATGGSGNYSYSWTGPGGYNSTDQNPTLTNVQLSDAGTYTLNVSDGNGCWNATTTDLTVNTNPLDGTITLDVDSQDGVCELSTGHSASVQEYGVGVNASYSWTVSGDATNIGGINTSTVTWDATSYSTGNVSLDVLVTDSISGCSVTNSTTVTVYQSPDCTITVPPEVCAESTGNTASVADAGVGAIYNWTVTGGTITGGAGTREITWTAGTGASATIDVDVTDINGCQCSSSTVVTINPLPDGTISTASEVCAGSSSFTSVPDAGIGSIYSWTVSGGNIIGDSSNNYITWEAGAGPSATIDVTITDPNSCQTSNSTVVTIHANPTVAISPDPAEVCEGVNLQLFGNPAGGSGSYTTHSWTGAGATYLDDITAENPIFNHITPGTYSLTYTVTDSNSCTSSDSIDVVVHDYADLVVTKSIDDPSPNEGDTITYTVTLTNNGPCIATNIVITDSLPAGVTYSSNTPSQGSYDSGSGAWSAGSLANGASATLDISATVDAGTATQTITNTASVASSDQTDTVPANNSDSAALTVQGADLAVTKIVDDSAPNEGDTITYTITLTNNGPDTATNIVISDLLPAGVTYSSDTASQGTYDDSSGLWTVGTRANGASATLDISATVDAGTAAQTITNTASVTSVDQGDQTPANNSDSAALTVQSADLAVTKTVDDPIPNEGDIITYTVTLTNNGPDTATSIVISDLLPAGVTYSSNTPSQGTYISGSGAWSVGTLANGASATLDISATVDPGTAAQTITNTASVSNVDQADTIPANNSDSAALTVQSADLAVTKTVDDSAPNEGDTITYTITLVNNGPDTATNIVISDLLPAGVTYSSDTPSQGTYASGSGLWTVGTLANGASTTLDISATVNSGTTSQTITNTASISSVDQVDTVPANNSDSAALTVQGADLAVTKTVDGPSPNEGDTITYTITLVNNGPDTATNIVISDLLPSGVTYSSDTPSQGTYDSGSGLWTVGTLANAASATLTISATVNSGTASQTITNTASVSSVDQADSVPANNSDSVPITVQSADLAVTKIVDDPSPNEGDTITYTVTLTNNGLDTATNIVISDLLPAGVTYSSDTPSQGTYASGSGAWSVVSLANGASATLDISATVDSGTATQTIINTASVSSVDQADSVPANNSDSASLTVQGADLAVTKIVNDPIPNEGDTITYTVTLTNNGPDTATSIVISDLLPAGVTYSSDTPSQGTYTSGSGLWTVGTLANGASATLSISATVDTGTATQTITNTASVSSVDQADSVPANNSDSAVLTVQGADLEVLKTVDNSAPNEGDTITYTITLTNNGPDTATSIVISDLLPAGVTYSSDTPSQGTYASGSGLWTVGTLANAASATLTISATVDAGTRGSTIINTASVSSVDQGDQTPANNSDSAAITVEGADLVVTKIVDDSAPNEGDTITYTITLTNNGPTEATNVIITDALPSGVTYSSDTPSQGTYDSGSGAWSVGSLANGASATLDISATVDSGTAAQTIINTASVTSVDQGDANPANNSDSAPITVLGADLAVSKTVNDPIPNEGDTITYTVTLTNNGPDTATNIVISDLLPVGVTHSSDTPSQGTYDSGSGLWSVGSLANGASATLSISATVDSGTATQTITNTASVSSVDQADPTPGNNSDSAALTVQSADLAVTKIVDDSAPNEGDTITYTVTLINNGPDTATNIVITDSLPSGVTYSSDTPSQGTYDSGSGAWSVGSIANGASATLDILATVDSGTAGQIITNTASVSSVDQADPIPGNNSDSASLTVQSADLAVAKTVDDSFPNEGDTITYTITLINNGPDTATSIVISDLLPAGVTYSSDTPSQGTYASGSGLWSVGTLANGASATLDISTLVDSGTAAQTITNTASVSSVDQGDQTPANNSDSAAITVEGADLEVIKIVDDSAPNEGDTITYTITLTNNGPTEATNIIMTDLLPSGVTYVSDIPSQGSYDDGSGAWSVGSLANGASATLDISATVDSGTAAQTIINTASVTGVDQGDANPANNSDSAPITVLGADLAVSKTVNDPSPNEGDTITYTVTLTNNGPDTATNIVITDSLPSGVTYSSDTPSQGSYDDGSGAWSVGSLANGASATLDISATVDSGTATQTITNTASVSSVDQADPTPGNNSDSAALTVQGADLEVSKNVNDSFPNEGDTITYTITLINNGPDTATSIVISDLLPAGATYSSDQPSQGSYDNGSGAWSVGSIANEASATLDISATVNVGTAAQTIINTAELTTVDQADLDSLPNNNQPTEDDQDSAALTVQAADLEVTKTVSNPFPNEGDTITYTITLDNNGPDTATNIVISDLLPAGVTYSSDTPSQGSYDSGSGDWSVGSLAVIASATLTISATVDAGFGGNTITNTASVSSVDQADYDPANNSDSAAITGVIIEAWKTYALANDADSNGDFSPGDTIEYTIEIRNDAGNTAQDVVYTDTVDPNTTLVCNLPTTPTTTQGILTCPSEPDTLFVDVGDIGGLGIVTITFQAIIDLPLSAGVTQVSNQGFIYGSNFATEPTDDPDTGTEDDPTVTQVDAVAIDPAIKTDSLLVDADNNTMVSPGDIILYEVTFWNIGNMDATGVIYSDTPDPSTDFMVGTVTCDKAGWSLITDTPNLIEVYVGTVQGYSQEMVTVTVQAIVLRLPSGNPAYIYNQGVIYSDQAPPVLTDDPETFGSDDPTRTSLHNWGMQVPVFPSLYVGVAAALMAGILAYFLRRRLIHRE